PKPASLGGFWRLRVALGVVLAGDLVSQTLERLLHDREILTYVLIALTPWPAGSLRLHREARGGERRTPALRSGGRPHPAPRALRIRSSEASRRTTRAARAVAAECRASGALAPSKGVYDGACSPPTGGAGGAAPSARSAPPRASRPPSTTACC